MIRNARESDVGRIVEMGRRFRKDTTYSKYLSENPTRMAHLAEQLIAQKGLLVLDRADRPGTDGVVGMLGFIVHSHFISGESVAGEVFWWVEPENRGQGLELLTEMEKRARAAGATQIQMIAPDPKLERLYRHLGFEFVESTYQRAL